MRYLLAIAVCVSLQACSGNPLAPTVQARFTCFTQLRTYCSADGTQCWQEVDRYVSATACPIVPID